MFTLGQLRYLVNEVYESVPEDTHVMIQEQPNWPLRFDIQGTCLHSQIEKDEEDEEVDLDDPMRPDEEDENSTDVPAEPESDILYIVSSGYAPSDLNPYGHRKAWEVARDG